MKKKFNVYLDCSTINNTLGLPMPTSEVISFEVDDFNKDKVLGDLVTQKWFSVKTENGTKIISTKYILWIEILD